MAETINPDKLPPGHAVFQEKDKNAIIAYKGKLYDNRSGEPLPLDFQWLKDRNFTLSPAVIPFLQKERSKVAETKKCTSCQWGELPVSAKFCSECGTTQPERILRPADDSMLQEFLKAMDPADPFAVMDMLGPQRSPRPIEQVTPEEMARIAYQEGLAPSAIAVPGEGSRPTAAKGEITARGTVNFSAPPRR
jgi:hypothetical protein